MRKRNRLPTCGFLEAVRSGELHHFLCSLSAMNSTSKSESSRTQCKSHLLLMFCAILGGLGGVPPFLRQRRHLKDIKTTVPRLWNGLCGPNGFSHELKLDGLCIHHWTTNVRSFFSMEMKWRKDQRKHIRFHLWWSRCTSDPERPVGRPPGFSEDRRDSRDRRRDSRERRRDSRERRERDRRRGDRAVRPFGGAVTSGNRKKSDGLPPRSEVQMAGQAM